MLALLGGMPVVAAAETVLDAKSIQQLFSGNSAVGKHLLHNYSFQRYYGVEGKLRSRVLDSDGEIKGAPDEGRWWVEKNQLCLSWQGFDQPLCRNVILHDDGRHEKTLMKGKRFRKPIVHYEEFQAGNAFSL